MFNASSLAAIPELALILGIMVVIHELGHFIAAKACGVRVEAFAIGFGKRLFGIVHNGTDYCINLIPLGGYVKMAGELPGETGSDDPAEFQNHPRWQRTVIAFAGPIANFILAFILITGLYMTHKEVPAYITQTAVADYISPNSPISRTGLQPGDRIVHFDSIENPTWIDLEQRAGLNFNQNAPFSFTHEGRRVDTRLFVDNSSKTRVEDFDFEQLGIVPVAQPNPMQVATLTAPNLPAAQAGLAPGDTILAFDNLPLHSVYALLAYLKDQAGKPTLLTVQRKDPSGAAKILPISITPIYTDSQRGKAWVLGFGPVPPPANIERLSLAQAIPASWELNLKNSRLIFDVLRRLFTRQVSVKSLSSPIGIGVQVHDAFLAKGWMPIIETTAMISLNLGIFNLLPIPILDGGMILFLLIESLMRRDLNQAVKERVYQVAFVCLILFAAVVIFNDITKYLPTHLKT